MSLGLPRDVPGRVADDEPFGFDPEARYFGVGRIGTDQLQDYAARKGWELDEARRWLITLIDDEAVTAAQAAPAA